VVTVRTCIAWFNSQAQTVCLSDLYGSQDNQQLFPYLVLVQKLNNMICTYITGITQRGICERGHGRGLYDVAIINK
jgi:hypothetical protein